MKQLATSFNSDKVVIPAFNDKMMLLLYDDDNISTSPRTASRQLIVKWTSSDFKSNPQIQEVQVVIVLINRRMFTLLESRRMKFATVSENHQ